ncbi:MAG: hypothetical protein O7F71_11850 [Gammaproteobacteria bacterium]|nr:hypothetical protein [Gammaproteobacteria bacterium]
MTDQSEQTRSFGNQRVLSLAALVIALGGVVLAVTNLINLNAVAKDDSLRQALAEQMGSDTNLLNRLASSAEINKAIHETVVESIKEDRVLQQTMLDQHLSSGELQSLVNRRSEFALEEFRASTDFEQAVLAVVREGGDSADPVKELQTTLARYERELSQLAIQVRDDESAQAVNAMQGQLAELQRNIVGLSDQVACAVALRSNVPRTFLLKSNDSTRLPGYNLVISLSRLRNGAVETVSVSAPEGSANQVNTKVIGNVQMGRPFSIDQADVSYEGVITFAHKRLFGRALIGFEIRMVSVGGDSCLPDQPGATEMANAVAARADA